MELLGYSMLVVVILLSPNTNSGVIENLAKKQAGLTDGRYDGNGGIINRDTNYDDIIITGDTNSADAEDPTKEPDVTTVVDDVSTETTTNTATEEDKCKSKCGYNYEESGVTCTNYTNDDDVVTCSCNDPKRVFNNDTKSCMSKCHAICASDYAMAGVTCTPDFLIRGAVSCYCDDPTKLFDYDDQECKDLCTVNPCKNGGECYYRKGTWWTECHCPQPYYGSKCEMHPCSKTPCLNGGECSFDRAGRIKCDCTEPYYGNNCEKDPCTGNPCNNGGKCNFFKGTRERVCDCLHPYFGYNCEIQKTACDGARAFAVCQRMRAACVVDVTAVEGFRCVCGVGYVEKNGVCTEKTACDEARSIEVCRRKGEACVVDATAAEGFRCVCDVGYFEKNGVCKGDDRNQKFVVVSSQPNVIGLVLLAIVILLLLCVGFCIIRIIQKLNAALNSLPAVK